MKVSSAQESLTHPFEIEIEGILYKLQLRPRDSEVFKNVPIWTLNSNGLDYKVRTVFYLKSRNDFEEFNRFIF